MLLYDHGKILQCCKTSVLQASVQCKQKHLLVLHESVPADAGSHKQTGEGFQTDGPTTEKTRRVYVLSR